MERSCEVCGKRYEAQRSSSRFCSPACRLKHFRDETPSLESLPVTELLVPTSTLEEEYVRRELEITRAQMRSGVLKEVSYGGKTRLERAEAYARWRWRAFHDGEVHSL